MRTINLEFETMGAQVILLGVQGESLVTRITADVSGWLEEWPDGEVVVRLIDENGLSHLADTVVEDGTMIWTVTATDTAEKGYGVGVTELVQGDVVKKSIPFTTRVIAEPNASGEAPEVVPGWVEQFISRMQAMESDAEASKNAAVAASNTAQAAASTAVAQTGLIDEVILVQDTVPTAEHNKLYIKRTLPNGIEVATEAELEALRTEVQGDLDEIQEDVQTAKQQSEGAIKVTEQTLTDAQQAQARENIGAADQGDVADLKSHLYGSSTTNYTEGKNLTATSVSHAVIDDPNACISELIPLSWGTSAYANYFFTDDVSDSNSYYVFFYDADEQYLDWSKRQANTTYRGIKAPANTAYAQFSFKKGFSAYVANNTNPPTTIYWTAQASAGGGIISDIGDLSDLNTTDKQNLVNAINEVNNKDSASEYFELVDGQNLLNQSDTDFVTGCFLNTNGSVSEYSGYNISGYIAVNEGDKLIGSYSMPTGSGSIEFRTVACYGSNKVVLSNKGVYSVSQFVVPSGVAFVRICYGTGSYGNVVQICKTDSNYFKPYKPYEEPHYEIKEEYLPTGEAPLHVLLPSDIYVAVGRTIELYNKQIVLDYENYYFRWVCNIGSAYERKFSVTGTTVGSYNLQLYIYDKYMNVCWVGLCIIHVVSASTHVKKIMPIGDSLTRGKAWLPEVMLLSSNNVEWLGTRYSNNLKDSENNTYSKVNHEGRSGWSAGNYLTDSVYDQDTAYDGVPDVDGSANPFWDGTKFSLEHYLTTQTGVPTPDAVQIFLGTNDLTVSVESAVENITAMATSIRSEYPSLPIFVCNTIFRSNQNGYGSTGSDAYAGGGGNNSWQYDQDARVMDLMVGLRASLANVTGVYFIPLASCMDREYDFGQVMTKVNPRSDVEVPMPAESVHPTAVGYYQMADLMYSFYCGILAE